MRDWKHYLHYIRLFFGHAPFEHVKSVFYLAVLFAFLFANAIVSAAPFLSQYSLLKGSDYDVMLEYTYRESIDLQTVKEKNYFAQRGFRIRSKDGKTVIGEPTNDRDRINFYTRAFFCICGSDYETSYFTRKNLISREVVSGNTPGIILDYRTAAALGAKTGEEFYIDIGKMFDSGGIFQDKIETFLLPVLGIMKPFHKNGVEMYSPDASLIFLTEEDFSILTDPTDRSLEEISMISFVKGDVPPGDKRETERETREDALLVLKENAFSSDGLQSWGIPALAGIVLAAALVYFETDRMRKLYAGELRVLRLLGMKKRHRMLLLGAVSSADFLLAWLLAALAVKLYYLDVFSKTWVPGGSYALISACVGLLILLTVAVKCAVSRDQ